MPLSEFAKANLKTHLHHSSSVVNDDGEPAIGDGPSGDTSTGAFELVIDGGGAEITTGIKYNLEIPFACTITGWSLLADQSGSIQVDLWKDTYANYPPTDADSMVNGSEPAIVNDDKAQGSDLSDWTTTECAAGDTVRVNVDSVSSHQLVTLVLKYTRTTS